MNNTSIRVLIADDHSLVRRGMRELLAHESDLEVSGETDSIAATLSKLVEDVPDVVVVDLTFGDGNGIELIKQIKSHHPDVHVVVSTMHDETLFGERCFRAGAEAYVNKEEASERVVDAIRSVVAGKLYMSEKLNERILHRTFSNRDGRVRSPIESLTDRELEVFAMIGRGMTTREIADKLYLSPKTIESYRENIKSKLRARNSAELSRLAVQWALEGKLSDKAPDETV